VKHDEPENNENQEKSDEQKNKTKPEICDPNFLLSGEQLRERLGKNLTYNFCLKSTLSNF
jgi:hypothetical protein